MNSLSLLFRLLDDVGVGHVRIRARPAFATVGAVADDVVFPVPAGLEVLIRTAPWIVLEDLHKTRNQHAKAFTVVGQSAVLEIERIDRAAIGRDVSLGALTFGAVKIRAGGVGYHGGE